MLTAHPLVALLLIAACQPSTPAPDWPAKAPKGHVAAYCDDAMRAADARSQRRSLSARGAVAGGAAAAIATPWVARENRAAALLSVGFAGALALAAHRSSLAARHEAAIAVAMSQCVGVSDNAEAIRIARRAYRWWLDGDLDVADMIRATEPAPDPDEGAPTEPPPWAEQPDADAPPDVFQVRAWRRKSSAD